MPSCVYDTCCGCIELRTGCIIIGYLNLVSLIILISMACFDLIGEDLTMSIISLVFLIFMAILNIIFLIGIHKNKRVFVKAYIAVSVVFLALAVIANPFQEFVLLDRLRNIISYILTAYFLLVIRSYYYKMSEDEKRANIDI